MVNPIKSAAFVGMVLAATIWAAAPASAAVLFEQAPPDGADGAVQSSIFAAELADNFTLGAASTVSSVEWWGFYVDLLGALGPGGLVPDGTPTTDSFSVVLYEDAGGLPSDPSALALTGMITRTLTGLTSAPPVGLNFVAPVYLYELTLAAPLALDSGTYHLSVINDPLLLGADPAIWFRSLSATGDGVVSVRNPNWVPSGVADLAFRVSGEVAAQPAPAPPTLLLMAALLLSLAQLRRTAGRA